MGIFIGIYLLILLEKIDINFTIHYINYRIEKLHDEKVQLLRELKHAKYFLKILKAQNIHYRLVFISF